MQFKKYSQRVGEMMHVEMRACPLKAPTFSTTLQDKASACNTELLALMLVLEYVSTDFSMVFTLLKHVSLLFDDL